MKKITYLLFLFITTISFSQVGIGTTTPDASSVLDITATDAGLLVPRLTTTQRDALSSPATGLLIFNTTTKSFQYNFGDGSSVNWYSLDAQSDTSSNSSSNVYFGKAFISSTGVLTITGIPFQPTSVSFNAAANIDNWNLNTDGVGGNNNVNNRDNYQGFMNGYAQVSGGSIVQQVISVGGSGASLNDISRYSSSSHCIGIRYGDNDGVSLGRTRASLTEFTTDGFKLNVNEKVDNLIILFTAHK